MIDIDIYNCRNGYLNFGHDGNYNDVIFEYDLDKTLNFNNLCSTYCLNIAMYYIQSPQITQYEERKKPIKQ